MVSIRITDSGEFLDTEGVRLAYSLQAFDLTELSNRKGEFSIDFQLPDTPTNRKKLSYATEDFLNTNTTYKRINVEILQNGELVKAGYLKIVGRFEKINVTFFSGSSDWMGLLEGSIKDVDLSDFDHIFTDGIIITGLTKTDEYIYPLIDYGFLNNSQGSPSDPINERSLRPATFVRDLLIIMFREIGWKLSGDLMDDIWFKRLIIPFSLEKFNHSGQWIKDRTLDLRKTTSQSLFASPDIITRWDAEFPPDPDDTPANWDGANTYTADEPMKITVKLSASFSVVTATPSLRIEVDSVSVASVVVSAAEDFSVEYSATVIAGQTIRATILDAVGTWTIRSASFKIVDIEEIQFNSTVQMAALLPDISKRDFLKFIFFHRNCYLNTNNFSKTLTIGFFKDIKNNTQDDWTAKVESKSVDFSKLFQNYAQSTKMNYRTSDNDAQLLAYKESNEGKHFGDGVITIDNDFLETDNDFYEAPFAGTVNIYSLKGRSNMPFIPVSSNGTDFDEVQDPVARILYVIPGINLLLTTDNGEITFPSGTVTVANFAFFSKALLGTYLDNVDEGLAFDVPNIKNVSSRGLLERYFREVDMILQRGKIETFMMRITEVDVRDWDISKPVAITFEGGSKIYYKNKLLNFDSDNTLHQVELIPFE